MTKTKGNKKGIGIVLAAIFVISVSTVIIASSSVPTAESKIAIEAVATTVSVDPASQTVQPGDTFDVDVRVDDVIFMGADQGTLLFDPTAMQVTGVTEGDFLKTAGSTMGAGMEIIDNVNGEVTFFYTLIAQGVGVDGSGILATIHFQAEPDVECTFPLELTDVILSDGNGNQITIDAINDGTVKIDNTPPTVEILSPYDDVWFDSEPVLVTFHAWDNKADELYYEIYVDGEPYASGMAPNYTETTVDLGILPDCDHVIKVEVTDDVGLTGFDEVTIHVDLYPPEVEIIWPETCTWYDSEPVLVTFFPWDNKADELYYEIYVDGEPYASGMAPNCTETTVDLGILDECDHVISVYVEDYVGKWNESEEVTIHVDLYPPEVEILTPEEGQVYAGSCVILDFTADDVGECPSGIVETYYVLDGGTPVTITGSTTIENLDPCDHTLLVCAVDQVEKEGCDEVIFDVYPGDITGDGKVNIFDLQQLAWAFNSVPGDPNWNEKADLNCDGKVNVFDLQILGWNFGNDYTDMCNLM